MKIAIYDMDKTITRRPSWMSWLFFHARTEAPWRLALAPLMLLPAMGFLLRIVDRKRLKELTQAIMIGKSADITRIDRAARRFAGRFGAANELPGALEQIARDRADGWRIAIATASCGYYAAHLAARWGVDDVIATRNPVQGGRLSNRISGENCYDAAKLAMIREWLPGTPERIRFYSDHISDLPALLWADEPVAANPSPALRAEAEKRAWPIREWV